MIKFKTDVEVGESCVSISLQDKILVIGSCFSDEIGVKLRQGGFNICLNPFGTLYNPISVCNSIQRLASGIPFTKDDCIEMGAGAGLICSFSHHTSFARPNQEAFLENANTSLKTASDFYKDCNKVIITLGTSWCYNLKTTGETVSNCLKRNASEFSRELLSLSHEITLLKLLISKFSKDTKEIRGKEFIFTVSPIRHLADGAHGNQISKSLLLIAIDEVLKLFPNVVDYFPSYEILLDDLRDYRFYADDMVHPSSLAVNYIWEKFKKFAVPSSEEEQILQNEKSYRQSLHIPIH